MKKNILFILAFIMTISILMVSLTDDIEAKRKGFYCCLVHPAMDCLETCFGCSCETIIVTP